MIVYDGSDLDTALEVSRTTADGNGAFGEGSQEGAPFELGQIDRADVYLVAYDGACNSSGAPVRVREHELIATLGGKVPGESADNPNVFEARKWFTNRLWQPDAEEPPEVFGLGSKDAGALSTEGAGQWHDRSNMPDKPPGQWDREGAYDTWRDRWVVLTGPQEGEERATTWEWDGAAWHMMLPLDPEGDGEPNWRTWEGMAFDPLRGKTVMFGGGTYWGYSDETWEWDGSSWALRYPVDPEGDGNPSARNQFGMTWHGGLGEVVLAGGSHAGGPHA